MAIDSTEVDLKEYVVQGLRQELPNNHGFVFDVRKAYPTDPSLLPCISVTQASGGLGQQTIGGQWNNVQDPETQEWYRVEADYYRQSVEITVWALNPDDRDKIARHVRKALLRLRRQLDMRKGFHNATMTENGDSQDFVENQPRDVFMFTFMMGGEGNQVNLTPIPEMEGEFSIGATFTQLSDEIDSDD